jgi:hypothetical protein
VNRLEWWWPRKWWRYPAAARHHLRYRLTFTLRPSLRCSHRNRLGIRCFRPWTYDHWCGLHNSICWHHDRAGNRHVPPDRAKL